MQVVTLVALTEEKTSKLKCNNSTASNVLVYMKKTKPDKSSTHDVLVDCVLVTLFIFIARSIVLAFFLSRVKFGTSSKYKSSCC